MSLQVIDIKVMPYLNHVSSVPGCLVQCAAAAREEVTFVLHTVDSQFTVASPLKSPLLSVSNDVP